jgi:hypothetical protein
MSNYSSIPRQVDEFDFPVKKHVDVVISALRFHHTNIFELEQSQNSSDTNVLSSFGTSSSARNIGILVAVIIGGMLLIGYCCFVKSSAKLKIHDMLNRTYHTGYV